MSNKKKKKPSLTSEEMRRMMREGDMCPYGRDTKVLDTRCRNCHFNRLEDDACYGNAEDVRRLKKRLQLDY